MPIQKTQFILITVFISLTPFTINTFLPSLPFIAESLTISLSQAGQSLSFFFMAMAVGQVFAGPLSDRLGRRPMILSGAFLFFCASIICWLSTDFTQLLIGRVGQALGICCIASSGRAIVNDLLPPREAAGVFSSVMSISGLNPILAPSLGALLLAFFGWHSIFVVHTLLAITVFTFSYFKFPETREYHPSKVSELFSTYWKLITNPQVFVYLLAASFSVATMLTFLGSVPPVMGLLLVDQPSLIAFLLGINATGLVIGGLLSKVALKWLEPRAILFRFIFISLFLLIAMFVVVSAQPKSITLYLTVQFFISITLSFVQANAIAIALGAAKRRAGAASALFGIGSFAFAAIFSTIANYLFDGTLVGPAIAVGSCLFIMALLISLGEIITRKMRFEE